MPLIDPKCRVLLQKKHNNLLRNEEAPLILSPSVQKPTTVNQYNLLRNEKVALLIEGKCTEPNYSNQ